MDCGLLYDFHIVVVRHDDGIRIKAGCQWLTFDAAVSYWSNKPGRELVPALLGYIKARVSAAGWLLSSAKKEAA